MSGNEGAKELLEILRSLDNRLSRLEPGQQRNRTPFMKTIKAPSPYLEVSEKMLTEDGLQTNTTVPFCTVCHRSLEGVHYVCHHCNRVLCADCVVIVNNRAHCEDCVREFHVDMSRRDYFVLISLANGLKDYETIAKTVSATKEDVKDSVTCLLSSNLVSIDNKCLGLLYDYQLTDQGLIAIQLYRRIYGKEEDAVLFGQNLRTIVFSGE